MKTTPEIMFALRELGHSNRAIARVFGVDHHTVAKYISKLPKKKSIRNIFFI